MKHVLRGVGSFVRTPETPKESAKLLTIPFSHYCEKARWALDLSPLRDSYMEDAHAPVFHILPAMALTKDRKQTGTPILVLAGKSETEAPVVVQDSAAILEHLAVAYPEELGHLYPPGEAGKQARALEKDYGDRLGPQTRKLVYWEMWQALQEGISTASPQVEYHLPTAEAWMWRWGKGKLLPLMMQRMGINETSAVTALEDCRQVFREASALLAEWEGGPRKYLLGGERMTAADLSFAALAYPLVNPPAYASLNASPWVRRLAKYTHEFRASPAGQHVLRLYAEERYLDSSSSSSSSSSLRLRTANRDKWPWQSKI